MQNTNCLLYTSCFKVVTLLSVFTLIGSGNSPQRQRSLFVGAPKYFVLRPHDGASGKYNAKYQTDLIGNIIVECSFYKKVYKESALLFNYPADYKTDHIIIRLIF